MLAGPTGNCSAGTSGEHQGGDRCIIRLEDKVGETVRMGRNRVALERQLRWKREKKG